VAPRLSKWLELSLAQLPHSWSDFTGFCRPCAEKG